MNVARGAADCRKTVMFCGLFAIAQSIRVESRQAQPVREESRKDADGRDEAAAEVVDGVVVDGHEVPRLVLRQRHPTVSFLPTLR